MAIDKGGLDYPIVSTYDATGVKAFKQDVQDLLGLLASLKSVSANLGLGGAGGNVVTNTTFNTLQQQVNSYRQSLQNIQNQINSTNNSVNTLTQNLGGGGGGSGGSGGNGLLGAFSRIISYVAVFQVIRTIFHDLATGIKSSVTEMVSFNQELQTSRLGIASLLTALVDIKNAQGQTVSAAERLSLAQKEAVTQTEKLRREALATTATFESLSQTFQVALGPGLSAGLSIDQVRLFTVQVSQAAAALGLAQNQLSEEIRSILGGTIQPRNTRIAVALGITNQDITQAKELGNLYDFLVGKFQAFTTASKVSTQTLSVIVANIRSAVSQILGKGGEGLFETLQKVLSDVRDNLYTIDKITGEVKLNPGLVEGVKTLGDALSDVVKEGKALFDTFNRNEFKNLMQGISADIKVAALVVDGAVRALHTVDIAADYAARATFALIRQNMKEFDYDPDKGVELTARGEAAVKNVQALRDKAKSFGDVGGTFLSRGDTNPQAVSKELDALREKARQAKIDLDFSSQFIGLTGNVSSQVKLVQEALDQQAKITETLNGVIKTSEEQLDNIQTRRAKLEEQQNTLHEKEKAALQFANQLLSVRGEIETKILDVENKRAEIQKQYDKDAAYPQQFGADLQGLRAQMAALDTELATLRSDKAVLDQEVGRFGSGARPDGNTYRLHSTSFQPNAADQGGTLSVAERAKVVDLANQKAIIDRDEISLQAQLKALEEERLSIINDANISSTLRLKLAAQEAIYAQQTENLRLRANLMAAQASASTSARERAGDNTARLQQVVDTDQRKVTDLSLQNTLLERQQTLKEAAYAKELSSQEKVLDNIKREIELENEKPDSEKNQARLQNLDKQQIDAQSTIASIMQEQNTEQTGFRLQQAAINAELEEAKKKLEESVAIMERPVEMGIKIAFRDLAKNLPNEFEMTYNLVTASVKGLGQVISDTIIDAFDPTNKKSLRQRFSEFLRSIASEMIKTLVQIAVVRSTLSIFGGMGLGLAGGGPVAGTGFAEGGRVGRGESSWAHMFAGGMASGGFFGRPGGLDPSDTIPIWAAVGEWVIKARSAAMYGADVMSAINEGAIPAPMLQAAVKSRTMTPSNTSGGYATGGSVGTSAGSGVGVAVVAPSNEAIERLFRGGKNAVLDFFESHRTEIRTRMGV